MIFGLTGSLASTLKAPLTTRAARTACDLYFATAEAQQHIDFVASEMEREALVHRIDVIQQGSDKLEKMIADEEKMVEAQNVTRQALYYLQAARARLDMRRSSALSGLLPYVPGMSGVPLRQLLANKVRAEEANQKAITKLEKESGWDLAIAAGARRQLSQFNSTANVSEFGGFGEATLTYNFGRHSANNHSDRAAAAYLDFKKNETGDVSRQSAVLKKQIEDTLSFLHPQLTALLEHDSDIKTALKSTEGLSTNNSMTFRSQLLADEIVLRVDIGDIQFRIEWLESYLRDNF
jgi:hypothetical protein